MRQTTNEILEKGNNKLPEMLEDTKEKKAVFKRYSYFELINLPKKEWILPGMIGKGDLVQIFGPSNEGKSFVVMDLLFACITGGLFGQVQARKLENVAYMTDEGKSGIGARLEAIARNRNVSNENIERLSLFLDVPQLHNEGSELGAVPFVEEWKAFGETLDLLVIDTQHAATIGANENDAKDAGIIIGKLRFIQKELGCTIVLVHHSTKAGGSDRGSSSFRAAWDTQIEIKPSEEIGGKEYRSFQCTKQKDAERFAPQTFSLWPYEESCFVLWGKPEGEGAEEDAKGKDAKEKILNLLRQSKESLTVKSISEQIGIGHNYTGKTCRKLREEKSVSFEKRKEGSQTPFFHWIEPSAQQLF